MSNRHIVYSDAELNGVYLGNPFDPSDPVTLVPWDEAMKMAEPPKHLSPVTLSVLDEARRKVDPLHTLVMNAILFGKG